MTSSFGSKDENNGKIQMNISSLDLKHLNAFERTHLIVLSLETHDHDNEILLRNIRWRMEKAGVQFPSVEIRYENVSVEAGVHVGKRALPTLPNFTQNLIESALTRLGILPSNKRKFPILHNMSGVLKPGRFTLLLGPPGAGKSILMQTLAGKVDKDLKFSGKILYNGQELHEFLPVRTSAYISQNDVHIGDLTVKETLNFSAKVQGSGFWKTVVKELEDKENELVIEPNPVVSTFLKALVEEDVSSKVFTDYYLRILGLDGCADTFVGNDAKRGISGGEKKRVTSGEVLVGSKQVLFADEISSGLDSSTTYEVTKCLRNFTHLQNATTLIALLQPAPETYNLFDDILLLSEGHVVYHGPREQIIEFFQDQGFVCPERKNVADFLQEVTSLKDQRQYWHRQQPYCYVSVQQFADAFEASRLGQSIKADLSAPFPKENSHPDALVTKPFAVPQWDLFKALFEREGVLMKRNAFLYIAQTIQTIIVALVTMSVFLRTELEIDIAGGYNLLGALFFSLSTLCFDGYLEMSLLVMRLPVFYKQRDNSLFPAWAFTLPMFILSIPFSLWVSLVWVTMTYYVIGFTPEAGKFFCHLLEMFLVHNMSIGMFRVIGACGRTMVVANTLGSFFAASFFTLGGFVIAKGDIHPWWIWGFWISPVAYAENVLTNNEFKGSRWQQALAPDVVTMSPGQTLGDFILESRSLISSNNWYWVGVGVSVAYVLFFNCILVLSLKYLNPLGRSQPMVSEEFIEAKHLVRTGENIIGKLSSAHSGAGTASAPDNCHNGSKLGQLSRMELRHKTGQKIAPKKSTGPVQSDEGTPQDQGDAASTAEALEAGEGLGKRGMYLPFQPLTLSFKDINYSVEMPSEMKAEGATGDHLHLLRNVSGAFRPRVLTALVGMTGAGKTTLMDVLAGRKTGGKIEGDVWVSGYPKVHETFARISGYCEQNDIHTPQVTVWESLLYSAWLRLPKDVDKATREVFVDEVLELVELDTLRDALVGLPGETGLSIEQRKRLTIAVELVANPSIIFMDEPTSGLDARAAAIVMRTVRNTVDTGRTVVCTIHQPSIDIFEAFDELLLMQRGGQVIYMGPLGINSQIMVDYFLSIEGIPKIPEGGNPATWMLEVTHPVAAEKLNVDFAEIFRNSEQYRLNDELIEALKVPPEGQEDLKFKTEFSTSSWTQFSACLWKRSRMYWRAPEYNVVRYLFCLVVALFLGSVFWDLGTKHSTQQDILNIMGALYTAALFLGWSNATTVQPMLAVERNIFYREQAAGMYSGLPYAMAQGIIEIPYIFFQTLLYALITYTLIHFEWNVAKVFWYILFMFLTLLFFTFYGMMSIAITPNQQLAMVVSAFFFSLWNLFSGFIILKKNIPDWWRWYCNINPVAWTLYGLIASQLDDVETTIVEYGVVPNPSVKEFIESYFGYEGNFLGQVAAIQVGFTLTFFFIFCFAFSALNFLHR